MMFQGIADHNDKIDHKQRLTICMNIVIANMMD